MVPKEELSIGVVIPCHNYGRFLDEAVDSVLAQSRPPDEILIVNDGSTDQTESVIASILDQGIPGISARHHQPNRGSIATFNDGVRAVGGDLLVILSADDRMSSNYLQDLSVPFADDATVGFTYAETRLFGARQAVWPAQRFDVRRLVEDNYVNGSAMFRRKLFEDVGGFDPRFERLGREDWAFWIAAVANGWRGVGVTTCYLEYRRHSSASRNRATLASTASTRFRLRRTAPELVHLRDVLSGTLRDFRRLRWQTRG